MNGGWLRSVMWMAGLLVAVAACAPAGDPGDPTTGAGPAAAESTAAESTATGSTATGSTATGSPAADGVAAPDSRGHRLAGGTTLRGHGFAGGDRLRSR